MAGVTGVNKLPVQELGNQHGWKNMMKPNFWKLKWNKVDTISLWGTSPPARLELEKILNLHHPRRNRFTSNWDLEVMQLGSLSATWTVFINLYVLCFGMACYNLGAQDAVSPKLMPLPEGAFSGSFGSALMPPPEEAAGNWKCLEQRFSQIAPLVNCNCNRVTFMVPFCFGVSLHVARHRSLLHRRS